MSKKLNTKQIEARNESYFRIAITFFIGIILMIFTFGAISLNDEEEIK